MFDSKDLWIMYMAMIILFFLRADPNKKIWGSLKAKHYIFVGLVGVGCFSVQWVVCEYVIL